VVGTVSIRVIHVGNHPVLTGLTPRMATTFMACMAAMFLFFTWILLRRVRLELARAAVEGIRCDLLSLSECRDPDPGRADGRIAAGATPADTLVAGPAGAAVTGHAGMVEAQSRVPYTDVG